MSCPSARPIAINRCLRAAWLAEGLRLLAEGLDKDGWLERMEEMVSAENKGHDTIQKSMRYLRHIWVEAGEGAVLRPEAIRLHQKSKDASRNQLLSWGMAIATYPFLSEVATVCGRILRVQPEMKLEQLLRKLCESFGEKETVRRSGRYSLGLIVELGFLRKTGKPGGYEAAQVVRISDGKLASWLMRAWFMALQKDVPIDRVTVSGHPSLFFLDAKALVDLALADGTLALERMSLSQETVRLVENPKPPGRGEHGESSARGEKKRRSLPEVPASPKRGGPGSGARSRPPSKPRIKRRTGSSSPKA